MAKWTKNKKESPLEFATRLWDTADPPLTIRQASRLAGVLSQTLSKCLSRREYYATRRCPTCHQLPGKPRDNYGRQLLAQKKLPRAQAEIRMTRLELAAMREADLQRPDVKSESTPNNNAPGSSPQG